MSPLLLRHRLACALSLAAAGAWCAPEEVADLAAEVGRLGWIVYAARSPAGDYDLYRCRPDGSAPAALTRTPEYNEVWPQFAPDGSRMLYRQLARSEAVDGNRHGAQGRPVLARGDGRDPQPLGGEGELPWARWSPDGRQVVCLSVRGFDFIDLESRRIVRHLPRHGFFQQPAWSPDGRWLLGVANSFGSSWSVAGMDAESGRAWPISTVDCCTPDWFPDSRQVIYSWRSPQPDGTSDPWTQLWRADREGRRRELVYAEAGRHVYGGQVSPDGRYVVFTGNAVEDGDPGAQGAPMAVMRLADAPIIGGDSPALRQRFPTARRGPVLVLPVGWEPCWTAAAGPGEAR